MGLNDRAKTDLQIFLSVSSEELERIIDHIATALKMNQHERILNLRGDQFADKDLDANTADVVIGVLYALSEYTHNQKDKVRFLKELKLLGFGSSDLNKIEHVANRLEEIGFVSFAVDTRRMTELNNVGPPTLMNLEMITDHRLFTKSDGVREFIHSIICSIDTMNRVDQGIMVQPNRLTFQLSPSQLDSIIEQLQTFRKGAFQEIDEIRRLKVSGGTSNV